MIKKYIIGAAISLILLLALFLFNSHDLTKSTGKGVYTFPEDLIYFVNINNQIPNYFCLSEEKFSGDISFKIKQGVFLLTLYNINLGIKSSSSTGSYDLSKSSNLQSFMSLASPLVEPVYLGGGQGFLFGGTVSLPEVYIYNTTDPVVTDNTYTINLDVADLDLPGVGGYVYVLNFSEEENFGGENSNILSGSFSVVDRNCTLGLNNVQISVVGGGSLSSGKSVNCSANVDGKFFSDLSKSSDKINFSLAWYGATGLTNYRTLSGTSSGVVCNLKNSCSAIFSVTEGHATNWTCIITVDDGKTMITKKSANLSMINSPPTLIKSIPNLTFTGGFKENFLTLSEYFNDADGNSLTYSITNLDSSKINLSADSSGKVNITSPSTLNLSEDFYIVVSDGINSTRSNVFSITIVRATSISGSGTGTGSGCSPNWTYTEWSDCGSNGIRMRTVIDINSCTGNVTKPSETENCIYGGGEPLQTTPETQFPQNLPESKKESIFDNKLLLIGMVLGTFLLLLLILLLLDRLKKNKEKNLIKPKEKPKEEAHAEYKPKFETPVKQVREEVNIVNTSELNKYVRDMLNKGARVDSIKEKLISSGWQKEQVEDAVNFVRIKDFVDSMLEKGQSRENIRKLLKDKGWKDNFIDKILK